MIDRSGLRFGGLTVVERASRTEGRSASRWLCRCAAGHLVEVGGGALNRLEGRAGGGCIRCLRVSDEDRQKIIAAYLGGKASTAVANDHGVNWSTVIRSTRNAGLPVRDMSECHRTHACNHQYFDEIDSEEKAYWLGFLGADGCVMENHRVSVGLSSVDRGHLEKLRSALESSHPIVTEQRGAGAYGSSNTNAVFRVFSKSMAGALARLGLGPRKSLTLVAPSLRPDLIRHFWRGMVDGDGWVFYSRAGSWHVGLCGSHESMEQFALLVREICGSRAKPSAQGKISALSLSCRNALRMLHYLYDGATVALDRKHKLYLTAAAEGRPTEGEWRNPNAWRSRAVVRLFDGAQGLLFAS